MCLALRILDDVVEKSGLHAMFGNLFHALVIFPASLNNTNQRWPGLSNRAGNTYPQLFQFWDIAYFINFVSFHQKDRVSQGSE